MAPPAPQPFQYGAHDTPGSSRGSPGCWAVPSQASALTNTFCKHYLFLPPLHSSTVACFSVLPCAISALLFLNQPACSSLRRCPPGSAARHRATSGLYLHDSCMPALPCHSCAFGSEPFRILSLHFAEGSVSHLVCGRQTVSPQKGKRNSTGAEQ